MKKGAKLSKSNIKFTRPEGEIPAATWEWIEGKKTARKIKKGEPLDWGMLG